MMNKQQTLFETENQPCTIYGVSGSAFPVNRVCGQCRVFGRLQ